EVEPREERELLQEDRPLAPGPCLRDAPPRVIELDRGLDRRLPPSEVVAGQKPAVSPSRAVHYLRLGREGRDRLRDEAAVEGVACCVDHRLAASSARLVQYPSPGH